MTVTLSPDDDMVDDMVNDVDDDVDDDLVDDLDNDDLVDDRHPDFLLLGVVSLLGRASGGRVLSSLRASTLRLIVYCVL